MHKTLCYLYLFTCGSYLKWVFWPNIPFLVTSGSSSKERNYHEALRGLVVVVRGPPLPVIVYLWEWIRCGRHSVLGHEDLHGWALLVRLDYLSGSWI